MDTKKLLNNILTGYRGFSLRTWIAIFSTFVDSIGTSVSIFLTLYLSIVIKMPIPLIGLIISFFGVGTFLGAYGGGFLCDKFDHRQLSIVMLFGSGTAISLIPLFNNMIALLIIVISAGLFYGMFKPANTLNLINDASPNDQARINGLYRVAVNLGMGAASLIGGILASIYFPLVFWFDGITSAIAALILFLFYRASFLPIPIQHKKSKDLSSPVSIDKRVLIFCILLLVNCLVFFQIRTTYPLFLNTNYRINATTFGYLYLLNCMMIVLLEVPILNAVKNYNQIMIAAMGSSLLCASMFILPFNSQIIWAIFSCILLTLGEILLFSTMLTLIISRSTEYNKGKYIGFYQSMFSLASILAPILGGSIYSIHPPLLWYGCGLIGLGSLLAYQIASFSQAKQEVSIDFN